MLTLGHEHSPKKPFSSELARSGFKVYPIDGAAKPPPVNGRRDFYKIVLITGRMTVYSGERTTEVTDTVLFLVNPHVPHTFVDHAGERSGYACLFTEAFIAGRERTNLVQHSPLFRVDSVPIIPLNSGQASFLTGIFQKSLTIYGGDYEGRDDMLRNCLTLVLHEALRIQPAPHEPTPKNAATRVTDLFVELLEK